MSGVDPRNLPGLLLALMVALPHACAASAAPKPAAQEAPVSTVPSVSVRVNPLPTPAFVLQPKLSYGKDAAASAKPFWKSKPALLKKMNEDRAIIVSVNREDSKDGKIIFTMAGAGVVARDKFACFTLAQDYPKLKEVSDNFRTVTYDASERRLFVITEALGYQARMLMQLTPVSEDWRSEIQWEVIWGSFKGMKGVIGFEKLGPRATEVSFTGRFEATELPIPKFLMGFALEVVTQKVAEKMRSYLEKNAP